MYLIDASLKCNANCAYCYNSKLREHTDGLETDLEAIKKTCEALYAKSKSDFCLHGGEPCSWPFEVFDGLLKFSFEKTGKSSIQTNGTIVTDKHIEALKKYKTSVGVSLDGLWPLNKLRGNKKTTSITIKTIERLVKEGISTGLIAVIHRANGLPEHRQTMKDFIVWAKELNISGRLNPCITGNREIDLSPEETLDFYKDISSWMMERGIAGWSPFRDIINSLLGKPDTVCVFRPCHPYHTKAGIAITSKGEVSMCHKFHSEILLNTMQHADTRDLVLSQTDCLGCSYFNNCFGGCPSAATDGDWRNKDRNCPSWKYLFGYYSRVIKSLGINPEKQPGKKVEKSCTTKGHSDGIEHTDGDTRHLDSHLDSGHSDGIEHIDGDSRHLDSGG